MFSKLTSVKKLKSFHGGLKKIKQDSYKLKRPLHWNSVDEEEASVVDVSDTDTDHVIINTPSSSTSTLLTDSPHQHNSDYVSRDQHTTGRYTQEKTRRLQDWENLRSEFWSAYLDSLIPYNQVCSSCYESMATNTLYRCKDCCPWESICRSCLLSRHQQPHLHIFQEWKEKTFVDAVMDTPVWRVGDHICDTSFTKNIVIIDDKGRQHERLVGFCDCESAARTLIKLHLWPSTTKHPKVAFSMELMKWLYGMFVESQTSVKSFCEVLKARSTKLDRQYMTIKIDHPFEDQDDGTSCPPCYNSSKRIFCFDADFQLVRKRSAGHQWDVPKHENHFFIDQNLVDNHIFQYTADKGNRNENCNDFKAGNALRSKSRNQKLSETALFGSTCRHGFPYSFFSLKHGERLGYAVYLIKHLLDQFKDQKLCIMYDIACSLHAHLKKHDTDILDKIELAIPIFHAFGHRIDCQVIYSPRRLTGFGLTDGESVKRLWSYLGRFSCITKETTPENRVDILVAGLLYYNSKLREKLVSASEEGIRENIRIHLKERHLLLHLIKKAKGQSVAKRINKQLKTCSNKLKALINQLNDLLPSNSNVTFKDMVENSEHDSSSLDNLKRWAIDLRLIINRSREEQIMLKDEMKNTFYFFLSIFQNLQFMYKQCQNKSEISAIIREGLFYQIKLQSLQKHYKEFVDLCNVSPFFSNLLNIENVELSYDCESDNYESDDNDENECYDDYDDDS